MSKIFIKINQDYKSFKSGFETELSGNLIILSGVNGSGKSQLLELMKYSGNGIANLTLDGKQVTSYDILLKSFKDNITIPEFEGVSFSNIINIASIKNQVFSHYTNGNLHDLHSMGIQNSFGSKAKKILLKEFGEKAFFNQEITEKQILSTDFGDLVAQSNDTFSNYISQIFLGYALNVFNAQQRAGESKTIFDDSLVGDAPRTTLNNLFKKLKFDYRFKDNYKIKQIQDGLDEYPRLYQIDDQGEIIENQWRNISELSEGEKAILSLSFGSLGWSKGFESELLLLDEFDATLNPSLIEAFYNIIDEYFIKKGKVVIIVTHSSATIGLAPENTSFYEVFKEKDLVTRISPVERNEYSEFEVGHKMFYKEIQDQKKRAIELAKKVAHTKKIIEDNKQNRLLVEDTYDSIYKVTRLKLNNINHTDADYEEKFETNSTFSILPMNGAGKISGFLKGSTLTDYGSKKIIGLLDFDKEGTENFHNLYKESSWGNYWEGDKGSGFYKINNTYRNIGALLLPIPGRLQILADKNHKYFSNYIEVENLLPHHYLIDNNLVSEEVICGVTYLKIKDEKKLKLGIDLIKHDFGIFNDFKPLFDQIENLFNNILVLNDPTPTQPTT